MHNDERKDTKTILYYIVVRNIYVYGSTHTYQNWQREHRGRGPNKDQHRCCNYPNDNNTIQMSKYL